MQDASFAEMRARNRLGIAIAAMTKIMATTISNSISENPFGVFCLMELIGPQLNDCAPVSDREHPEGHSLVSFGLFARLPKQFNTRDLAGSVKSVSSDKRHLRTGAAEKCQIVLLIGQSLLFAEGFAERIRGVTRRQLHSRSHKKERGESPRLSPLSSRITSVYCNAGSPPTANGLQPAPVPL